ncbi:MAG: serine/threonine protein kinase [Planktothrix sp.]
MAFTTGQQLHNGKYIIERVLNLGRFGVSYLAHDKHKHRVVIKTFRDDIWQQLSATEKERMNNRWLYEAGVLSRFNHPYIVQFLQPFIEQGQVCLVMEHIAGENLASLPERSLSVETALEYIRQISSALKAVHNQNLVHRDVKPANIMLRAGKPEVILIDFGLAGGNDETLTRNTSTREEGFAAPELYDANEKAQAYTDIYGLGATLYTLLSGDPPPSAQERAKKGQGKLPPLPQVDKRIFRAIEQAMEWDWEKRLQTVDEFLDLLGVSGSEESISNGKNEQEALAETRRQTRIAAYTLYVTGISILVAILLGLFGQEVKDFLLNSFRESVPQETQN